MVSLSEKWAHQLAMHDVIPAEDEALYSYGFRQGAVFLLNIATMLCIGWRMGMVKESITFMLAYLPLRRMAGGYHARTQLRCYLLGIVLTVSVLLAVKWLPWNLYLCSVLLIVSTGIIIWLAPVEDQNKPLDEMEKERYAKKVRRMLKLEYGVCTGMILIKQRYLAMTIVASLVGLGILLIIGGNDKLLKKNRLKM